MLLKVSGLSIVAWSAAGVILGLRAERSFRRLPSLRPAAGSSGLPFLSIIIPARDEEANLAALLPTLHELDYPGMYEVLVVDDHSSDLTPVVAGRHGVRLICLEKLPEGWLGKPHACHAGAQAAHGEWLLFTDADTRHTPTGAAEAVGFAIENHLEGLSLFLEQETRSATDRLALMTAFAGLFAGRRAGHPLVNGQYILLRRDVYFASGGFAAVRGEALEDLALGHLLIKMGYQIPLLRGERAGKVLMYRDTKQAFHGMTRLGAGALRWSGGGALLTAGFVTALMYPLITLYGVLTGQVRRRWLPVSWVVTSIIMIPWARRCASSAWAFLAPFGALFVQFAALYGLVNRLLGRNLKWKGRPV